MRPAYRLSSVRPLVRYVDDQQAVIDTHLAMTPAPPPFEPGQQGPELEVCLAIHGSDGFHDESRKPLQLIQGRGSVRLELVEPQRWWPAGMGEQPLYEMTVGVMVGDALLDERTFTLGLTSVRHDAQHDASGVAPPRMLVNGRVCAVRSLITVDRVDESQLLPATGDSIMLVRDHYAPEVLYAAADRAGVLLIQCVPIDAAAMPEREVAAQVDRLVPHPSLAGWFVGHLGGISDDVARCIHQLDPTRSVLRKLPRVPEEQGV